MILKTIEVSLSKEARRIVDSNGNVASTWARIGVTAEVEEGDILDKSIELLKAEIQPEIDAWLDDQGGYATVTGARLAEQGLEEAPSIEEVLDDVFDGEPYSISVVSEDPAAADGDDEIPL